MSLKKSITGELQNFNYEYNEENYDKELSDKIELSISDIKLSLTQEYIKDCHLEKITKLTHLTHLELYDCVSLHDKLNFLSNLTNLQYLSLPFSKLNDEDLIALVPLTNLISLELTQNQITGTGFTNLNFNKLKSLTMINTYLNLQGVKELCHSFPNLEHFDYCSSSYCNCSGFSNNSRMHTEFNNDCLTELCNNLNFLKELYLTDVTITEYHSLVYCPSLHKLALYHSECPSNYIGFPNERPSDKYLYYEYYTQVTSLPILPNLKSLNLCREFSKIVMSNIHLYVSLEDLNISSLTNDLIQPNIEKLLNLNKLCIHAYLQNTNLTFLNNLSQLEHLDLRYNHDLGNDSLKYIANLTNLKYINLIGTKVTNDAVNNYKHSFNQNCIIYN